MKRSTDFAELHQHLPKDLFVDVAKRAWVALFQTEPTRECLAIIWARMLLESAQTGKHYRPERLFEEIVDQLMFLSDYSNYPLWDSVNVGDLESYIASLDAHGYFKSINEHYGDMNTLVIDFLVEEDDLPTLPIPPPEPADDFADTLPETPKSISQSKFRALADIAINTEYSFHAKKEVKDLK